jgi:muramoyltetrapeptide carboxypeptidase
VKQSPRIGWAGLKTGAIIDVIAPASKCSIEDLEKGIQALESWGYKVRIPKNLFGKHWTHSNTTKVRFQHLKQALYSDSSAIWCVHGGYGSMKLLPELQKLKPPKGIKIFLGLSDITSLHLYLNQHWGWPTLHAPIVTRIGRGDLPLKSIHELQKILSGSIQSLEFKLKALNIKAQNLESISGSIIGGNFATLMAGVGTPFQIKAKDSILFLEDVGEKAYRLDRLWEQLVQTGLLNQLRTVVLGDFTETHESDGKSFFNHFIRERALESKIPIFSGLPVGHGMVQRTLPLGVLAKVKNKKLFLNTGIQKKD